MSPRRHFSTQVIKISLATGLLCAGLGAAAQPAVTLLNVSYDPTRELYAGHNPKTSGDARWNSLAAWEFAERKYGSAVAEE